MHAFPNFNFFNQNDCYIDYSLNILALPLVAGKLLGKGFVVVSTIGALKGKRTVTSTAF
jgi:hypothetical protein